MTGIDVSGLRIKKDAREIIRETTFRVASGELVALLGPSGCGKTSLLRIIAGLDTPTAGQVTIGGFSPVEALKRGLVGFAFQDPALLPWLTNRENIEWLRRMQKDPAPKKLLNELSELAEMREGLLDQRPKKSSGGERQRASFLRTLALSVSYFVFDEPFSALDYHLRVRVIDRVRARMRAKGACCILVTHDIRDAVHFADRLIVYRSLPRLAGQDLPAGCFVEGPRIDLPDQRPYTIRERQEFFEASNQAHKECEDVDLHA